MLSKNIFMRPRNELEEGDQRPGAQEEQRPSVPDDLCVACPSCKKVLFPAIWRRTSTFVPSAAITSV